MQSRTKAALVYASAALVAAGALWISVQRGGKTRAGAEAILDAIPRETIVLVTADLDELRGSPVFANLVEGGREVPGVGKLDEICGFDPLMRIRALALAIPAGDTDELGLVALGPIEAPPLVECASKLITLRGGKPLVETQGAFTTVRDADGLQTGQIAARPGGPVLLGEGRFLRQMMGAVVGDVPNASAGAHPALREEMETGAVVATAIVPKELKERLQKEIGGESAPALGVVSAAFSLSTSASLGLRARIHCDEESACREIATSLRAAQEDAKGTMKARLLGLGPVLARMRVTESERGVDVKLDVSNEEATDFIDKITAFYALRRALLAEGDARETPVLEDERIEPRP